MATRIVFESYSNVTEVMELLESFILTLHRVGEDQYEVVDMETGEPIHFPSALLADMEGVKEIFEDGKKVWEMEADDKTLKSENMSEKVANAA